MSFISTYLVIVFYIALLYLGHYKGPLGYFICPHLPPPHPKKSKQNKKILNTLPFYHISIENNAESVYNKM